jgi:hypothetical protein
MGFKAYLMNLMTEDSLKHLSLDELYLMLMQTIDEYIAIPKVNANKAEFEIHQFKLSLIHKAITRKKVENQQPASA